MSDAERNRLYNAVEQLKPKNKAKLWLTIKDFMEKEKEVDVFNDDAPIVRIHKGNQEECESCSA